MSKQIRAHKSEQFLMFQNLKWSATSPTCKRMLKFSFFDSTYLFTKEDVPFVFAFLLKSISIFSYGETGDKVTFRNHGWIDLFRTNW